MYTLPVIDKTYSSAIQQIIDNKTKPLGALGQLESIAMQLALIQSQNEPQAITQLHLHKSHMLVFAADHGIAQQGVSIAPSEVTVQMVHNFLAGGAAINCFCNINDIALSVVDAGICQTIETDADNFYRQSLGFGTNDISNEPAMTIEQVESGLALGEQAVQRVIESGSSLVLLGEMGIGNTSSAAALLAAITEKSAEQCVGRGTGISNEQYELKKRLIDSALARIDKLPRDELTLLAQLGGFEIVQMIGAIIGAAKRNTPVVIDGFIVSVAALIAYKLNDNIRDYLIFSHCSDEQAHQLMLAEMNATPLLSLGLRLGEGSGAALAFPLIKAAVAFYNDMASFEHAGVENVT